MSALNNDFVFKEQDGALAFVGDFEGLYRSEPDPWLQSARDGGAMAHYYRFSRRRIAQALLDHRAHGRGFEVGCGHGHALEVIRRLGPYIAWSGGDISSAALRFARKRYPGTPFRFCDITDPEEDHPLVNVVLLNQTLWYVLDKFDVAVANCCRMLRDDGLFVISQAFLKGEQRYGRNVLDGFYGTMTTVAKRFPGLRMVDASFDDTGQHVHNDGLLVFRKC